MEIHNALNEFENNIRASVNKKYLEVVNELNNGFNKMLQTALSNADVFEDLIRGSVAELKVQLSSTTNTLPERDEEDGDTGFTPWNGKKEEEDIKRSTSEGENLNSFGFKPMASPWSYKKDVNEQRVVNLDEQVSRAVGNSSYPVSYPQNTNNNNNNTGMYYDPINKGTESPPLDQIMMNSGNGQFDHLDTTNLTPIKSNKNSNSSKPQLPPYHETKIDYEGNAELIIEDKKVLDNGLIVRSFTCKQCGHKVSYKRNLVVHIERQHKMKGR